MHLLEWEIKDPAFEFLANRDKPLRDASLRAVFLAESSAKSGQWGKEAAGKEVRRTRAKVLAAKVEADQEFVRAPAEKSP